LNKEFLGTLSVALTFLGYVPYFHSILKRRTRPHMFTWITWGLINIIAFAGLLTSGAGAGSWSTAASSALCLAVAGLSFLQGERHITKSDKLAFCAALAALPVWYFTKDPLGALLLLTLIDIAGSYPTFRKSYVDPYGESLFAWSIFGTKSLVILFAIETYSLATMIYPSAELLINGGIALLLAWQRSMMKRGGVV
jgi:hypothetical protein